MLKAQSLFRLSVAALAAVWCAWFGYGAVVGDRPGQWPLHRRV